MPTIRSQATEGSGLISDYSDIKTPCYVIDETSLQKNLDVLASVQERTGCRIILALKAFALFHVFPQLSKVLKGTTASSLHEACLGRDEFGGEVHVCAPAYDETEIRELLSVADHVVFNSFSQWKRHRGAVASCGRDVRCGIRVNPEHSEVTTEIYDPCRKHSRLGVTLEEFQDEGLDGISGVHFHALCEVNSDALERTLDVVENKFGDILSRMEWINLGGGHHITRDDYDVDRLCNIVSALRDRYDVEVYLEPGEAVTLNSGVLVSSVMDVVKNEIDIAILDASASAHMPDVLEMPYRPEIIGAGEPGEGACTYKLTGNTCLAGDVIGDYSFSKPLEAGDRLVFLDMAHYTMVKNTTFNGVNLPSIAIRDTAGNINILREFGYSDYKMRIG